MGSAGPRIQREREGATLQAPVESLATARLEEGEREKFDEAVSCVVLACRVAQRAREAQIKPNP